MLFVVTLIALHALFTQPSQIDRRPVDQHQQHSWASAHTGKWGQLTPPGKTDEKLKSGNMQKEQFSMCMLYFESNQGRQM